MSGADERLTALAANVWPGREIQRVTFVDRDGSEHSAVRRSAPGHEAGAHLLIVGSSPAGDGFAMHVPHADPGRPYTWRKRVADAA